MASFPLQLGLKKKKKENSKNQNEMGDWWRHSAYVGMTGSRRKQHVQKSVNTAQMDKLLFSNK